MKSSLLCSVQYCILRDCGFVLILCVVFTACRMESQIPLSLSSPKMPDVVKRASKAHGEEPKMHNLDTTTSRICSPMQSWLHCMEKRRLVGLSGFFWLILPALILQSFHPNLPRTQLQSRLKFTGSQVGRKWLKLAEAAKARAKATPRQPAGAQGCKGWKGAIASSTYGRPSTLHQARTLHPA